MKWFLAAVALVFGGSMLRWILRLDSPEDNRASRIGPLTADREAIYLPIAQEIETQSAIVGISLNDAIEERDAGQDEIAWRLVRLSVSEWDRLSEILSVLTTAMSEHVGDAQAAIATRNVVAHRFKSRVMVDHARMHELLDQLVFRSKLRFQLHLRMLRRAAETLTAQFRRAYRYADRTSDRSPELWNRLDFYFHDFDLVAKETLLAFRTLLSCLPHWSLAPLEADLKTILRRGVRSPVAPAV